MPGEASVGAWERGKGGQGLSPSLHKPPKAKFILGSPNTPHPTHQLSRFWINGGCERVGPGQEALGG